MQQDQARKNKTEKREEQESNSRGEIAMIETAERENSKEETAKGKQERGGSKGKTATGRQQRGESKMDITLRALERKHHTRRYAMVAGQWG